MKRFHVHLAVSDLDAGIRFYSALFASEPSVRRPEYAKWMLEDPRLNFAISTRSGTPGIDHLGLQADSAEELAEIGARLETAGRAVTAEAGAECCYARSDKLWSEDAQGTRWEAFHTVDSLPTYYGARGACATGARAVATDAASAADADVDLAVHAAADAPEPADAVCCGPVAGALHKAGCGIARCGTATR